MHVPKNVFRNVAILLGFICFCSTAYAADITWTGNGDGASWHDPENWNLTRVPALGDDVNIPDVGGTAEVIYSTGSTAINSLICSEPFRINGGTLDINAASSFNSTLAMRSGATLSGSGDITINGMFTWTGGTISGSGIFQVGGGMELSGTAEKWLKGIRTLRNTAVTIWTGSGMLRTGDQPIFENSAGATFDVQGDLKFDLVGQQPATFLNAGTFIKSSGSAAATIEAVFDNTGTVDIQSGTVVLTHGGTSTGTFTGPGSLQLGGLGGTHTLSSGSQIILRDVVLANGTTHLHGLYNLTGTTTVSSGTHTYHEDAHVSGIGQTFTLANGTVTIQTGTPLGMKVFNQSGGTFTVAGGKNVSITSYSLSSGILSGDGNVTVSGMFVWTGGTMENAGITHSSGEMQITGSGTKWLNDSRTLRNGGDGIFSGTGQIRTNGLSTFETLSGAMFDAQGDVKFDQVGQQYIHFNNAGTFVKSAGSGTTTMEVDFNNTGTLEVRTGTLLFTRSFIQTAGTTALLGGNLRTTQILDIQGGTLSGSGTITGDVSNGGQISPGLSVGILTIGGDYTQTAMGELQIDIGGLSPSADFDRLSITGTATLAGALQVSLINGFLPLLGNTFQIVSYAFNDGNFDTTNYPSLGDLGWSISYGSTATVLSVVSGQVVEPGDVNCDGSITPGDALCAFWRSILGSFQEECLCETSEQAAEVNGDGAITPGDALCIFWRAILGDWTEECRQPAVPVSAE